MFSSQRFYLWLVCAFLTLYVLVRAWVLLPLHDEVATFVHYIETGRILGEGSLLEANNHLLNSYLGRMMYLLFGEHYFLFRLPNVIAFAFYFWAIWKLTESFSKSLHRWIILLAIVCIPYVLDYFSYTRGYGLALAFFSWALVFLQKWIQSKSNKWLFSFIVMLLMCVASNLIFLVSTGVLVGYTFLYVLCHYSSFNLKQKGIVVCAYLLYLFGISPLIYFGIQLKNAGALYYGSLDGFWIVTGKTMCKYVLFYDALWIKWAVILISCICILSVVLIIKKVSFINYIKRTEAIIGGLILGNVISIIFLAKVMKINYPEDRAAMYFIPLVLLFVGSILSRSKRIQFLFFGFLFFPFTFLATLNFNTSIFSPDERMSEEFYSTVRKNIHPNSIVSVYPLQQLTFASLEKRFQKTKHLVNVQRDPDELSDIVLSKKVFITPAFLKNFQQIAEDPNSGHVAFKRKKAFKKSLIIDTIAQNHHSKAEFIPVFSGNIPDNWRKYPLEFLISGDCIISPKFKNINLVVSTSRANNEPITYEALNLRWYHGENATHFPIYFPYSIDRITEEEKQLFIYIWNPEHSWVTLKNARVKIIELKQ